MTDGMEPDETISILASADFFEICDQDQLRLLAFASERQQFLPGDVLFNYGEEALGAFVIVSGNVNLSDTPSKPEQTYTAAGPGTLIGEMGLMLKRINRATATAATRVDCLFVPRVSFDKLVRQYPDMAQRAAQRIEAQLGSFLGSFDNFRGQSDAS